MGERLEVRRATAADAATISGLLTQLGYENDEVSVLRRLETFHGARLDRVLVAVDGGRVVAVTSFSARPRFTDDGYVGQITSLVVAQNYRRRGVARQLVSHIERIATELGCVRVQVSSGKRQECDAAHEFYPSLGYEDAGRHHTVYEKRLSSTYVR